MEDKKTGADWDGVTPDREQAQNYLIYDILANSFAEYKTPTVAEGGEIRIPEWEVTVRPEVAEIKEHSILLYFYISSPKWGRELFECSAGMGETPKKAMSLAVGSFLFAMMDGICAMETDWEPRSLSSEFAGCSHRWKVYKSNIVGMGETPAQENCPDYWSALEVDIAKRLGNQKLCYVKIYGAKNGDDITGECRINDIKSEELSRRVAELVEGWKTEEFGSHKQFFFLRQQAETLRPYPFTDAELAACTELAVKLFHGCGTDEEYETFPQRLSEAVGDMSLAQELYAFLPEMCAENAFESIEYAEEVAFSFGEQTVSAYKSQLASYYTIQKALFDGFGGGAFSPWENEVYSAYISVSSIYSVICSAKEQGADLLADGGRVSLSFGVREGYELR